MANRESLVGKVIAQRYRIDSARTDGSGTSMVFDATDLRRREQVVIRLVLAESLIDLDNDIATVGDALEHFKHQTQQLAALNHPSLVSVDDWGTQSIDGDVYTFTVLEYFAAGTLREILDRGRRLTPSQALVVGLDACRALHFIHLRGWAHGDVRPANLFIGNDLRVRLGGLGIKRVVVAGQLSLEQARYAAPEIGLGEVPTERSDVYSLAMTLLESITGDVPFAAESAALTLAARVGKLLPVSAN
ncbi:MAG: serine/threonine protein kinase, partial [Ilumatobacteraceae bacterium]